MFRDGFSVHDLTTITRPVAGTLNRMFGDVAAVNDIGVKLHLAVIVRSAEDRVAAARPTPTAAA